MSVEESRETKVTELGGNVIAGAASGLVTARETADTMPGGHGWAQTVLSSCVASCI
jgi:hypothetical protein